MQRHVVNELELGDIVDFHKYDRLDFSTAKIVGHSATHGAVVALDRYDRGHVRLALMGRSPRSSYEPRLKAHNQFTPAEARLLASALLQAAREAEGKRA